jgi:hypothetical protein
MDDLPSTEKGPRQSDNASQTGTGTPRSADRGVEGSGGAGDESAVGELKVNRSGSGGSGGPSTSEPDSEGSTPASMEELLGGDRDHGASG